MGRDCGWVRTGEVVGKGMCRYGWLTGEWVGKGCVCRDGGWVRIGGVDLEGFV